MGLGDVSTDQLNRYQCRAMLIRSQKVMTSFAQYRIHRHGCA
jgi:DNA-directed RNA polymerase subunit N (RpoN/RPB10)